MDCIQTENKAVDLFVPGGHGHGFMPGDPDAGVLATYVSPAWCNGVQEEILNCIRDVGLVPSGADLTQLLQAIRIMVGIKTGGVGEVKTFARSTAPAGWLKLNGQTIGSAASGATARANADTQALYTLLWTEFPNTVLAIQDSTGAASSRGASAAADFAANKRLPLHDMRGEYPRGWDDGRAVDGGRVLGSPQAQQLLQHNHTTTELPHAHTAVTHETPHTHSYDDPGGGTSFPNANANTGTSGVNQTGGALTGLTVTIDAASTGLTVNNSVGGAELRTRNVAWLFCISY